MVDVTATPLEGQVTGTHLLLELADARTRQRITRESEMLSRLDGSRLMIRQLAHEIKNPLGGLRGAAQLLDRELHDGALKEYTTVIINEADRLRALVDSMLGPSRPPQMTQVNIHELCEHVFHLLRSEAPAGRRRSSATTIRACRAAVFDRNEIIQALLNVARNALQAVEPGRRPCHAAHARAVEHQYRHRAPSPGGQHRRSRTTVTACRRSCIAACSIRWSRAGRTARAWDWRWRRISSRAIAASSSSRAVPGHTVFTLLLPLEGTE